MTSLDELITAQNIREEWDEITLTHRVSRSIEAPTVDFILQICQGLRPSLQNLTSIDEAERWLYKRISAECALAYYTRARDTVEYALQCRNPMLPLDVLKGAYITCIIVSMLCAILNTTEHKSYLTRSAYELCVAARAISEILII